MKLNEKDGGGEIRDIDAEKINAKNHDTRH